MIILKNSKLKEIPYNQENIDKYKSKDNLLRHARYIKGLTNGIFIVEEDKLVGYIAWEKDTIIALEVISNYRNNGIATKLISNYFQFYKDHELSDEVVLSPFSAEGFKFIRHKIKMLSYEFNIKIKDSYCFET